MILFLKRWWGLVLILGLILGSSLYLHFTRETTEVAAAPTGRWGGGAAGRTVAVETRPIEVGPIEAFGRYSGTLISSRRVVVASKISGILEELSVNLGDPVERGQIVGRLNQSEIAEEVNQARAEVEVARAQLAEAKSSLELARQELERISTLRTQDFVTQAERDVVAARVVERESRREVAEANLTLRQASMRRAEIRLSYTQLMAVWEESDPVRFVSQRLLDPGSLVSVNQPVLEVVSLQNLIGRFFVTERDFYLIEVGQPVRVSLAGFTGRVVEGTVVRRSPQFSEDSRRAMIEVMIPNTDLSLNPGVFARFEVRLSREERATLVPVEAVVRRDNREGVFLVDESTRRVRFMPVERRVTEGGVTAVEGLPSEGLVVVLGQDRLVQGSSVTFSGNPILQGENEAPVRASREGSGERERPSTQPAQS